MPRPKLPSPERRRRAAARKNRWREQVGVVALQHPQPRTVEQASSSSNNLVAAKAPSLNLVDASYNEDNRGNDTD